MDKKVENAIEIQLALGKVALQNVNELFSDNVTKEITTPFNFGGDEKFEITIKRLD